MDESEADFPPNFEMQCCYLRSIIEEKEAVNIKEPATRYQYIAFRNIYSSVSSEPPSSVYFDLRQFSRAHNWSLLNCHYPFTQITCLKSSPHQTITQVLVSFTKHCQQKIVLQRQTNVYAVYFRRVPRGLGFGAVVVWEHTEIPLSIE